MCDCQRSPDRRMVQHVAQSGAHEETQQSRAENGSRLLGQLHGRHLGKPIAKTDMVHKVSRLLRSELLVMDSLPLQHGLPGLKLQPTSPHCAGRVPCTRRRSSISPIRRGVRHCKPASTSVNSLKGRKQKTQALAAAPSQSGNLLHQGKGSGQGRPSSELPFIAQ